MNLCGFKVGLDQPLFLIAGPCVIESEQLALDTAGSLKELTRELGFHFVYKSSFDKANRSSHTSFRGLGVEKGLEILEKVKSQMGLPVLTKTPRSMKSVLSLTYCRHPPFSVDKPISSIVLHRPVAPSTSKRASF